MGVKTFLFQNGNQCANITGGWSFGTDTTSLADEPADSSWASAAISSSKLSLMAQSSFDKTNWGTDDEPEIETTSISTIAYAQTINAIDLTHIEVLVCGGTSTYSGDGSSSDATYSLFVSKTPITAYSDWSGATMESGYDIINLDTSSLTGKYYIGIRAISRTYSGDGEGYWERTLFVKVGTVYAYDAEASEEFGSEASRPGSVGINNVARKMSGGYVGVNNVARKLTKGYVGDNNNKARLVWSSQPNAVAWCYDGQWLNDLSSGMSGEGWSYHELAEGSDDVGELTGRIVSDVDSSGLYQNRIMRIDVGAENANSVSYFMRSTDTIDFTNVEYVEIEFAAIGTATTNMELYFSIGSDKNTINDEGNFSYTAGGFLVGTGDVILGSTGANSISTASLNCSTVTGKQYFKIICGEDAPQAYVVISKIIAHYE